MCLSLLNDVIIIIIIIIVIIDINMNNYIPLFYKYWFLIVLINRILYSGTSSLRCRYSTDTSIYSGDAKFGPGEIFI